MNIAALQSSIDNGIEVLKELHLFKSKGTKFLYKNGVSDDFKKTSLSGDYFKIYRCAIQNLDYDLLLTDDSIFQFEIDPNGARFAFFQNPLEFISYENYILQFFDDYNEGYDEHFQMEYEQFRNEQNINTGAITIRYDLDYPNYNANIHSVSHYHIGNQNNVRIPCDKIITPLTFILFVIKHSYYHEWKVAIEEENEVLNHFLNLSKANCINLIDPHWIDRERREFFLT